MKMAVIACGIINIFAVIASPLLKQLQTHGSPIGHSYERAKHLLALHIGHFVFWADGTSVPYQFVTPDTLHKAGTAWSGFSLIFLPSFLSILHYFRIR